jgi:hypothetical protein
VFRFQDITNSSADTRNLTPETYPRYSPISVLAAPHGLLYLSTALEKAGLLEDELFAFYGKKI